MLAEETIQLLTGYVDGELSSRQRKAVLRLLQHVISVCNKHGKPVTLCGEMAGRPRCFLPLFGMGLRHFSMSPGFVPSIKNRTIDRFAGLDRT